MKKTTIILILCLSLSSVFGQKDSVAFAALQKEANSFIDSLKKSTTLTQFKEWADGELTSKGFRALDTLLRSIKVPVTSNIDKALQFSYQNLTAEKHDRFIGFYNYYIRVKYEKWYANKNKPL